MANTEYQLLSAQRPLLDEIEGALRTLKESRGRDGASLKVVCDAAGKLTPLNPEKAFERLQRAQGILGKHVIEEGRLDVLTAMAQTIEPNAMLDERKGMEIAVHVSKGVPKDHPLAAQLADQWEALAQKVRLRGDHKDSLELAIDAAKGVTPLATRAASEIVQSFNALETPREKYVAIRKVVGLTNSVNAAFPPIIVAASRLQSENEQLTSQLLRNIAGEGRGEAPGGGVPGA